MVDHNEANDSTIVEEITENTGSVGDSQESEQVDPHQLASGESPDFKWYIVHVLSGFENRVLKTLKERIVNHSMTEYFSDILVPEESVVANVNGKKRTMKKKFFPGYVLIKMIMTEKTWHLVKDTDKITGFIGGTKDNPTPISDEEAASMTASLQDGFKKSRAVANFSEGDSVKVIEGPFASFVGVVENVSDKGKVKVQVSIFGRPTPVELDFSQVEKV